MASDLNRVTLVGRLTRDPEIRHLANGDSVCSMRIAVNSRGKDSNDEWVDKPNFFDVSLFGKRGEAVAEHMGKGRRIGVDGSLAWREWEQDGQKRQAVQVKAFEVFFLDSRQEGATPSTPESDLPTAPDPGSQPTYHDDESIPF